MNPPNKCITIQKAKELQKEWRETRATVTTNGTTHKDTCEFHFDLEELQEYINYVREQSRKNDAERPGINVWLGAYPAEDDRPSLNTIFFSATRKMKPEEEDDSGRDYLESDEIEPMNTVGGLWPPLPYKG
ncbi:hypothetical protein [Christiangramia portivictoriae]|uniref:hypothetical protein n=1 Tax=Christiangramia portivictoriae TaxID=326069 RepID=UPI0004269230|nr:hypothetical protein [Christiangramia portivictoriae]